jgi:hypothetical protein
LSFVAFKGDGVVRQGRVLVAQSAELEVGIFRKAGKCIELDHLGKVEGAKDLKAIAVGLNGGVGVLVDTFDDSIYLFFLCRRVATGGNLTTQLFEEVDVVGHTRPRGMSHLFNRFP